MKVWKLIFQSEVRSTLRRKSRKGLVQDSYKENLDKSRSVVEILAAIQYIHQSYFTRGEHLYLYEKLTLTLALVCMTNFLKTLQLENDTCQAMNEDNPLHWQGDMWQATWEAFVGAT